MSGDVVMPSEESLKSDGISQPTSHSTRSSVRCLTPSASATSTTITTKDSDTRKIQSFAERFPSIFSPTALDKKKKKTKKTMAAAISVSTPPSTPLLNRRRSTASSLVTPAALSVDPLVDTKNVGSTKLVNALPLNLPSLIPKTKKKKKQMVIPEWMSDRPPVRLTSLSPSDLLVL